MSANDISNLKQQFTEAIQRDPKKTGIAAVLLAVMLVLVGRAVIGTSAEPPAATAMAPTAVGDSPTAQTIEIKSSHKRPGAAAAMQAWLNKPSPPLQRNLFAANLAAFPLSAHAAQPAKSDAQSPDESKEQQAATEAICNRAAELKLLSTVMSVPPQALINGQLVREGDELTVASAGSSDADGPTTFSIAKIEPRRVIVKSGGVLLEVRMK